MTYENKRKAKQLSQIMQKNKYFDSAVESYIEQLRTKQDWQNLEKKLIQYKNSGWDKEKLNKIFQWERKGCEIHSKSLDKSMITIKKMGSEITEEEFLDLKYWIQNNSHSKEAWNKNIVQLDDSLHIIKAKVMHLAFMSRSPTPVNIGQIIKNKD
jgi:hypothetical protein